MEERLLAIARMIRGPRHCDIGSDHGYLLRDLLTRRTIEFGIAVENKPAPHANSRQALAGLAAEVRLGDGLGPVAAGEVDSLSISGMGAELIVRILNAHPDRVPDRVVLQANRQSEMLRIWARESGYWLIDEVEVSGRWWYEIVSLERRPNQVDPAYHSQRLVDMGIDVDTALALGPHFVSRQQPLTERRFESEVAKLSAQPKLNAASQRRLAMLRSVLNAWR